MKRLLKSSVYMRKAFTLVELLVVISIIALLLSILMPSLQKAREQAKNVVCMSNLKQLTLAIKLYGYDNDGYIPPRYGDGTWGSNIWSTSWVCKLVIDGYLPESTQNLANSSKPVVHCTGEEGADCGWCPTYLKTPQAWVSGIPDNTPRTSYGINPWIDYEKELQVHIKPSRTCLIGDSFAETLAPWTINSFFVTTLHKNKTEANIVFVDAHIESLKKSEVPYPLEDSGFWGRAPGENPNDNNLGYWR